MDTERPKYSTWIRQSKVILFWIVSALILATGVILGFVLPPLFLVSLLSLPFVYIAFVISLTTYRFSDNGGGFQDKIHDIVVEALKPKASVLDIGCGSGKLIIKIARQLPGNHIGLDYWGKDWEYSKAQCEKNAELESVNGLKFVQASASSLPFESASIANVVSCLTFHEVADVSDKTDSLVEALRVLRPEGRFCFFDLFDQPGFYKNLDFVLQRIAAAGGEVEVVNRLRDTHRLPFPLDDPKALRFAVLIAGIKKQV